MCLREPYYVVLFYFIRDKKTASPLNLNVYIYLYIYMFVFLSDMPYKNNNFVVYFKRNKYRKKDFLKWTKIQITLFY